MSTTPRSISCGPRCAIFSEKASLNRERNMTMNCGVGRISKCEVAPDCASGGRTEALGRVFSRRLLTAMSGLSARTSSRGGDAGRLLRSGEATVLVVILIFFGVDFGAAGAGKSSAGTSPGDEGAEERSDESERLMVVVGVDEYMDVT